MERINYRDCYVKPSTESDGVWLSSRLRTADRDELAATTKLPAVRVLVDGIRASSPCYTIHTREGDPCGIFGTRESDDPAVGVVWMLCSDDLLTISRTFVRHSRGWLKELHGQYRQLYNVIDARNKVHLRWLSWMGFEFLQDIPKYGVEQRHFILFSHYE